MPSTVILGPQFYFYAEASGAVKTSQPAGGSFVDVGKIDKLVLNSKTEVRDVIAPYPAVLKRIDQIGTSRMTDFTMHFLQVSPIFWQVLFGTLALSAGSNKQFNVNEGSGLVKGWCKFQLYDQNWDASTNNTPHAYIDVWAALRMSEPFEAGTELADYTIAGAVIESPYNSGTIPVLA